MICKDFGNNRLWTRAVAWILQRSGHRVGQLWFKTFFLFYLVFFPSQAREIDDTDIYFMNKFGLIALRRNQLELASSAFRRVFRCYEHYKKKEGYKCFFLFYFASVFAIESRSFSIDWWCASLFVRKRGLLGGIWMGRFCSQQIFEVSASNWCHIGCLRSAQRFTASERVNTQFSIHSNWFLLSLPRNIYQ